ncbi:MAG TPA: sialidase family protein [Thermoanaerobaculia bacterium]|nr:sialidase family protein [Thermoanaerobaculia bacterium]
MRILRTLLPTVLLLACYQSKNFEPVRVERPAAAAASPQEPSIEIVATPAGKGSGEPFIFALEDGLGLSWLEPVEGTDRFALRFARYANEEWSHPRTIVERDDLFVNWADFPSIQADARGDLFAHWLQKSGKGTYSYDVRMAISKDGGATWGESFLLNRDGKQAEHGFVSLAALPEGGIAATWLDGRNMTGGDHGHGGGDMTLRYANVDSSGSITSDEELDDRACECCATGMAMTSSGPVIVYRDRSPEEVRDISYVRRDGATWSEPAAVHRDGWKINGCPVNGPQIDAIGADVATAWFTAAGEEQRVYASFSTDAGATFGEAIRIDDGKPVGRVDLVMIGPRTALVTWLEHTPGGAEIRLRRVTSDAPPDPSVKIADSDAARAAGFTRIGLSSGELWLAWTEQNAGSKGVRVARVRM